MKIGILSDTHNHHHNTQHALAAFEERGVSRLIHCGDVTSAEVILLFAGWNIAFVLGNMDLNRDELIDATRMIGVMPPMISREVEVDGKLIGVTHGHDQSILYRLMISGKYDYVCHGHTHQRRNEQRSAYSVRLINPGALGGSYPETRSVCVLDVHTAEVEFIEFPTLLS
ncbi:MAG: YfcE family phosphodiesterase [Chloroflexi bacterium]|nr:YfcE family phosphodiesterase [Chloroflexota bacterium]